MLQGFPKIYIQREDEVFIQAIEFNSEIIKVGDLASIVESDTLFVRIDKMSFLNGRLRIFSEDTFEHYDIDGISVVSGTWRKVKMIKDIENYKFGEYYYVEAKSGKESYRILGTNNYIKTTDCEDAKL